MQPTPRDPFLSIPVPDDGWEPMNDHDDFMDAVQHGVLTQKEIDRRYCRHGTYVGDPFGPDYLCGACEMGDDDEEEAP
jgi:predicted alpha/beta hydrolase